MWRRRDLRAIESFEPDRDRPCVHLIRWSLLCQRPISRSVESCCVISAQGKDVTVGDGTDSPAEPPVFNPPGLSEPVGQGLPSATSSPRIRVQSHVSYSRLHLHVNGGTSSSNLGTLTGLTTERKLIVLAVTAFSFYGWWPWPSTEHRASGVARPGITFFLLNLFLTIQLSCTVPPAISCSLIPATWRAHTSMRDRPGLMVIPRNGSLRLDQDIAKHVCRATN